MCKLEFSHVPQCLVIRTGPECLSTDINNQSTVFIIREGFVVTVSVCQLIFYGRITENSAAGVSAVSCLHFDLRKKADAFLHHSPPPPPARDSWLPVTWFFQHLFDYRCHANLFTNVGLLLPSAFDSLHWVPFGTSQYQNRKSITSLSPYSHFPSLCCFRGVDSTQHTHSVTHKVPPPRV